MKFHEDMSILNIIFVDPHKKKSSFNEIPQIVINPNIFLDGKPTL